MVGVLALPLLGGASDIRPNILFAIADDWGVHAGAYGDNVVKTPTFDRLAREGILFEHAYISSPSCAPSRAAILTGQWHWRLDDAANLYGSIPVKNPVYPDLLEAAGYFVGYSRKGWGPGENGDRPRNPAGTEDHQGAFIPGAWFADCDNGPTKTYMIENRDKDGEHQRLYDLSFAMRPELELFDMRKDPGQQNNIAANPEYSGILKKLSKQLNTELKESEDPRVVGGAEKFDAYAYGGGAPKHPSAPRNKRKKK
jgi:hypothetical protein